MARIRQRGKKFTAEVRYKGLYDSQSFANRRDAERWAAAAEREIDQGIYVPRSVVKQRAKADAEREACPTLAALMLAYQDTKEHRAKKGRDQEARRLVFLAKQPFALKPADQVTPTDIEAFIEDRLDDEVANDTVRLDLAAISIVFKNFKKKHGLTNPLADVDRPPPGKGRNRRLQEDEEEPLLAAADADERPFMRQAIILALETAMRRSELAELTWRQVSRQFKTITLEETKNETPRTVPLSTRALAALESIAGDQENPSGLVLGYDKERLSDAFERIRVKAGCPDLRWHDLRHEATSRLFENTDLRDIEIMAITGHRSPQMLARYAHLRARTLVDRLG
ncbi:tyrosine-type recombinase/integrase [Novispirillum sp. DQ9]|uniref:tyrosine-type recombinase/integrase n=1 Tax=Novispirillum sp. DQ9 TaxID=3398612 RepID=UPI003C7D13B9